MFTLGYIGHQLLLGRDYVAIEPIMRNKADMIAHMPFSLVSAVIFSAAFVWIYSRVRHSKSWPAEGVRFGLAIWAVAIVPLYLTNYTIEPWPGVFVAKILVSEVVATVTLGILIAVLAKNDIGAENGTSRTANVAQQGRTA